MILKILLVGPGLMPIPTDGWGAVETVIWHQKTYLEAQGIHVDILNEKGILAALRAKPWEYDIVHLHYDDYASLWNKLSYFFRFPLVVTSHYGYSAFPERWNDHYRKGIVPHLLRSQYLFVLTNEIKETYESLGAKGKIYVVPNGVELEKFVHSLCNNNKAICLGKIEPRKQQAKLARALSSHHKVICDFVGPCVDPSFAADNVNTFYLGPWTREQVYTELSKYACLVLLSDGEAHPLVVAEALAAGVSLVISPEAAGNLELQEWIYIVEDINSAAKAISQACESNNTHREAITQYSQKFHWDVIIKLYLETIGHVLQDYYGCWPKRSSNK